MVRTCGTRGKTGRAARRVLPYERCIDSLDMVELICDLEEKCDVDFGEPEGLKTVGELVEYIDSL